MGAGKESLGTTACACVNPTNKLGTVQLGVASYPGFLDERWNISRPPPVHLPGFEPGYEARVGKDGDSENNHDTKVHIQFITAMAI